MPGFVDFEIWIGALGAGPSGAAAAPIPVQVTNSPAGLAVGELSLDIDDANFQSELAGVRSIIPDLALRQSFGTRLFQAVFRDTVRDKWQDSWGRVSAGQAEGLRLRMLINVPDLALLPWELLSDGQNFLATAANLAVSRYLPVPEPPLLLMEDQLRVLLVVESPPGLPPTMPPVEAAEVDHIEAALTSLGATVSYTLLRNPTLTEVQNALQDDYHILHFLGHGTSGQLVITDDDKQRPLAISDQEFAQLVQGRRTLRLIVLNACHSSQADAGIFSGIGPALVQKRIPAVIAMQYPFVQLVTARRFSERFYASLASGRAVDVAVNEARQFLSAAGKLEERDWSTPVLYMGTRSGQILSVVRKDANSVEQAWHAVRAAAQGNEQSKAALAQLTQIFQELATRQRRLATLLDLADGLRVLQTDYAVCSEIVQQAEGNWLNIKIGTLRQAWQRVRQNGQEGLRALVDNHADVDTSTWFPALLAEANNIDIAFKVSSKALGEGVLAYGDQLAGARSLIAQQQRLAVTELITLSDRTLGRLSTM